MGNLIKKEETSMSSLSARRISRSGQSGGSFWRAKVFSLLIFTVVLAIFSHALVFRKNNKAVSNNVTSDDINEGTS